MKLLDGTVTIRPIAGTRPRGADTAEDQANDIDAIICFGIIVKGDTLHFEMISYECMRGLGKVMEDFRRPCVVEVIPVFDIQHAAARAGNDEFNKGIEAAVAAIEMVAWRRANT